MDILSSAQLTTEHSPTTIYSAWADPTSWPQWDPEVANVTYDASTKRGRLRPASGPATAFTVTEETADRRFVNRSNLPGANLTFDHSVEPAPSGSLVEVTIRVDGPLRRLWASILRRGMRDGAASSLNGLISHLDAA